MCEIVAYAELKTSVYLHYTEVSFVCVGQVCLGSAGEMIAFHLQPCDSATLIRRLYPVVLWCSGPILATKSNTEWSSLVCAWSNQINS